MTPSVEQILETSLYVDDLVRAEAFYRDVIGIDVIGKEPGRHVFFGVGNGVLLLFDAAETIKGRTFPPHGCRGPGHIAFAIKREALEEWRQRLVQHGVVVEKEVTWPLGGQSLYFR